MRSITARSGRSFEVRPLRRDDDERLTEAFDRLSPESRYRRFLQVKPHLSPSDVAHLLDVDCCRHVALALVPADAPDEIAGVARFVRSEQDPAEAEFAIVVDDAFQRDGVGSQLLRVLADAALEHGVQRFTATVLAENEGALRLINGVAVGRPRWTFNGPTAEAVIALAPAVSLAA